MIPLISKKFGVDSEINFHFSTEERELIKQHHLYESLCLAIVNGQVKNVKKILSSSELSQKLDKQFLYDMFDSILYYGKREGKSDVDWQYENIGIKMLAALLQKLPALVFNERFSIRELTLLKNNGVDITYSYKGSNLLHMSDNAEEFKWLVEQGVDINSLDMDSGVGTPLHVYIANENFSEAEKIINRFLNQLDLTTRDREGKTLLIIATKVRAENIIIKLLEHPNISNAINLQDERGRTALHYAAMLGCPNAIKALLDKGADAGLTSNKGNTALIYASSPTLLVETVLSNIEIHPKRAANAPSNGFKHGIMKDNKEIIITKNNANILYSHYAKQQNNRERLKYLNHLKETLSSQSLIETIQSSKTEIRELLLSKNLSSEVNQEQQVTYNYESS